MKIRAIRTVSILTALCLLCGLTAWTAGAAAAAEGVVTEEVGLVRVQALSDTLVRIELQGPKGFEDRPSYHIVNRSDWPGATVTKQAGASETRISTSALTVVVPHGVASLTGVYVTDHRGREIWRYTTLPSSTPYLPAPGDTPKAWVIADNPRVIPAPWGYNPMPADHAEYTDMNGWDTTNQAPDLFVFVPQGDAQRLRKEFTKLTGPSELIPLKTLGLWHSRYYAYSETTALETIDKYRTEGFPLDYFVVDTDWRISASIGYDINTTLFPDMARFIRTAHEDKQVDIVFNDHPEPQGSGHALSQQDLTYRNENLRRLLDIGLDAWWFDRNWSTTIRSPFSGINKESFGMYLYQAITRDYWETHKAEDAYARRPLIMGNVDGIDNGVFNRAPDLSSHRFSIQWTGDTHGQPGDLRQEIVDVVRSGAETSLPYVSSDIGGHMDVLSPEQWTRWTQFAAFSPIFRYHCTAGSNLDRAPWLYGAAAEDIARNYIGMRYRLLPLFYALSRENYDTGLPLVRRLDYNYPAYAESQDNTQYTLGDNLLVAPLWESVSTVTPVPAAWLSHDGQPGLLAEYFNNVSLSGEPALTRTEADVNFHLGYGSPGSPIQADNFSARWTGTLQVGGEDVQLAVTSDDGVRLWVDDVLAADHWVPSDSVTTYTDVTLPAGTRHTIRIEYYEGSNNAVLRLQYKRANAAGNERTVFIPDGRWIDVWTGAAYDGPQTITVHHTTQTSPLFVRAGSILPLAENASYIGEKPWDTIGLDVYPSARLSGASQLYEDDTTSVAYQAGLSRTTDLTTSFADGDVVVRIGAAAGAYPGALSARTWKVRVHAPDGWGALLAARLDGDSVTPVTMQKDPAAMPFGITGGAPDATVYEITVGPADVAVPHEIRLTFAHPTAETVPVYGGVPVDFEVSDAASPGSVSLTGAGGYDWAHFGLDGAGAVTRKSGAASPLIGALTAEGTPARWTGYSEFNWTDGDTPGAPAKNFVTAGVALPDGRFTLDL
ncbi:MAG: DUF5110 domain-containing protein, partial [Oscillospiraceae bacterium]|nr:DUF5110 domain-containing protein [Oscillospiraceae bacterium]